MNSTANALAMILSGGNTGSYKAAHEEDVTQQNIIAKRASFNQAVTPDRNVINAMVHARNLSSQ